MNYEQIRLKQERAFEDELKGLLQADIISKILYEAKIITDDDKTKTFESYNFKITNELAPDLYKLCHEVVKTLNFKESIDFFIINSPEMNAFVIPNTSEHGSHKICFNSTIIDKLDEDELKFVIGHEIGHLISRDYTIDQVVRFLFSKKQIHMMIHQKFMFWRKLNELTADRFGLMANRNIKKAISSFVKLNTGLPKHVLKIDTDIFLERSKEILDGHRTEVDTNVNSSHPIDSLRVVCLDLFSKSKNYNLLIQKQLEFEGNDDTCEDEELSLEIDKILQRFHQVGGELDNDRMHFMMSAGLIMANMDGEISKDELNCIISYISPYHLFPRYMLNNIIESGPEKINDIFNTSVNRLLDSESNRDSLEDEANNMISFLIEIAVTDSRIREKELNFLYDIGKKLFEFSKEKVATMIAEKIAYQFTPAVI